MKLFALLAGLVVTGVAAAQTPTPPPAGPYVHRVETATSADGLTWARDGKTVLEHASVPDAVLTASGAVRIYYVDASNVPENANCAELRGATTAVLGCRIVGIPTRKALDPAIVRLADGRYRLYYFAADDRPDASGAHQVRSAISRDGMRFTDEGLAFSHGGLVDPDVFWTGKEWLMYVFADGDTIVARSPDGRRFTFVGSLGLRGYGTTSPVRLPDGRFRLYAFAQGGQTDFVSFISNDGVRWTKEDGVRLQAAAGEQITDPQVVRLRDGTWKMVFKVDPTPPKAPPQPKP